VATASSTTTTDSIASTDWTNPVILTQNGINSATVTLYARNNNSSTAPTLTRTGEAEYTFSSGILSGTIPAGWTQAIPPEVNGSVIWAIQATAAGVGATDKILNTEWSTNPRVLSQQGAPGAQGTRGSRQLYSSSASYTSTYTLSPNAAGFASYAVTATSLIAAATSGSIPTTPIKGDTVTFSNPTVGSEYVYTLTYGDSAWATPGTVIDGSLLVTGSVTSAKIDTRGLSIKDDNGNVILQAGSVLDWSAIPSGVVSSQNLIRNGSFQQVSASNFTSNYREPITITSGSVTSNVASLNYATQSPVPFVVGEQIIVSGVTPAIFNGTFTVTAATSTQVRYQLVTGNTTVTVVGNITGTRFLTNDGRASNGSIYREGYFDLISDDYIAVDNTQTYQLKVSAKSVGSGGNSVAYFHAACYDRDRQLIRDFQNQHYANTRTTLAADLISGATTVTVTSSANWQTTTGGLRYIGFSIDGYAPYTYAKISLPYSSLIGSTITLAAAYSGPTIKVGTPVANYYEGGSFYNSCIANNVTVPNTWTDYVGSISPIPSTDLYATGNNIFRHGTAFIRVGGLLNFGQTTTRVLRLDDWVAEQAPRIGDLGYSGDLNATFGASSATLTAGVGANLVYNGGLEDGIAGWAAGYNTTGRTDFTVGQNLDTSFNLSGQGLGFSRLLGSSTAGTVFDAAQSGIGRYIPVTPGTRYEVSALLNTHRCTGYVGVVWYTQNYTYINEVPGNVVSFQSGVTTLGDLRSSQAFAVAPANAQFAGLYVRGTSIGQNDMYVFFKNIYFGQAGVAQTEYTPYAPGRAINQITKTNASTYISAAAIGNAQIDNLIYSNDFNGQLDTGGGFILSNGSNGWAISKAGNAVFNNIRVRGDITGSTGTFSGTVAAGNVTGALLRATTIPPTYGGWRFRLVTAVIDTNATNPGVTRWFINGGNQRRFLHLGGFPIPGPEGTVPHKIAGVFTANASAFGGQNQSMDLELFGFARTSMNFNDGLWQYYGEQLSNTGSSGPFNNTCTISGATQSTFSTDKIVDLFVSANNCDSILGNYSGLIWGVR
jgi:hypothetical protein